MTSAMAEVIGDEERQRWRKGYWTSGFATGPDTTMVVLWLTGIMYAAHLDSACRRFDSYSSGADGERCTSDAEWNETLWQSVNGTKCLSQDSFLAVSRYLHDPSLPGCATALADYRASAAAPYTCNCTGDHSFTDLGFRASTVSLWATMIVQLLVALIAPAFGTFLDFSSRRLHAWRRLWQLGVLSTLGMAVVARDNVWTVGLLFSMVSHVFVELSTVPRGSYLEDCVADPDDDKARGVLGGMRQFASYVDPNSLTLANSLTLP